MNEDIVCPLCDFEKNCGFFVEIVENKRFTIVKCQRCGLVYTLKSDICRGQDYMKSKHQYQKLRSNQYVKELFQMLLHAKVFMKQNPLLMDIGCSTGFLLDLAKKCGFRTKGVERSDIAAQEAALKGHEMLIEDVLDIDIPVLSVDVVVLLHTLEHLSKLKFIMKKIRSVLKNNAIVIVEVPNLLHWILQKRVFIKRSLAPDRHLYHFTQGTLIRLFRISGFKIIKIEPANHYDKKGKLSCLFQFATTIFSSLSFALTGKVLSNSMRVYAKVDFRFAENNSEC